MFRIGKIYRSLCRRIYAVGRREFINDQNFKKYQRATIQEDTVFHEDSQIINLANDRSKIIIGKKCHVYGTLTIFPFSGKISLGDNCSVGDLSRIVSGKEIKIGSRVMIAHNVNILDNNSHPIDARLRHEDFMNAYSNGMKEYDLGGKEIIIEDDVWIGFNSIILKGVKIGRGAIIGAGSVVTKDVDPWTVNVGNPLRCVQKLVPLNF